MENFIERGRQQNLNAVYLPIVNLNREARKRYFIFAYLEKESYLYLHLYEVPEHKPALSQWVKCKAAILQKYNRSAVFAELQKHMFKAI